MHIHRMGMKLDSAVASAAAIVGKAAEAARRAEIRKRLLRGCSGDLTQDQAVMLSRWLEGGQDRQQGSRFPFCGGKLGNLGDGGPMERPGGL